jgi:signal transduction histidine kinase
VSLQAQADRQPALALTIKDDGAGFDTGDLTDQRFGLRGMRERAELIGAHLRIKSVVGQGTEVLVTLP